MEKIMISLWQPSDQDAEQWRTSLLDLGDELTGLGARTIRVMVADQAVAKAGNQRHTTSEDPFAGMMTLWLDSASQLDPIIEVVGARARRLDAHLVAESEPYPEIRRERLEHFGVRQVLGERLTGMCQVALLRRPDWLAYDEWHTIWRRDHGPQAYPLQSNFGYRQNTVVRPLTPGAADIQAIVEEHFPDQAIGSPDGFFDMESDPERAAENLRAMGVSTKRFLDPAQSDVIQTSFYQLTE